jgi:hypothetical protein
MTIKKEKSEMCLSDRGFYLQNGSAYFLSHVEWLCLKPKKESGKRIKERKNNNYSVIPHFFLCRTHVRLVLMLWVLLWALLVLFCLNLFG